MNVGAKYLTAWLPLANSRRYLNDRSMGVFEGLFLVQPPK